MSVLLATIIHDTWEWDTNKQDNATKNTEIYKHNRRSPVVPGLRLGEAAKIGARLGQC